MLTQRREEKRVGKRGSTQERKRETERERESAHTQERERQRDRECTHAGERETESARTQERERERPQALWLLFLCFFLRPTPPGLPYVNWASQKCCLIYLRSSLHSLDLPLFYFCGFFPSLSFSPCHSGLFFPILTT